MVNVRRDPVQELEASLESQRKRADHMVELHHETLNLLDDSMEYVAMGELLKTFTQEMATYGVQPIMIVIADQMTGELSVCTPTRLDREYAQRCVAAVKAAAKA